MASASEAISLNQEDLVAEIDLNLDYEIDMAQSVKQVARADPKDIQVGLNTKSLPNS